MSVYCFMPGIGIRSLKNTANFSKILHGPVQNTFTKTFKGPRNHWLHYGISGVGEGALTLSWTQTPFWAARNSEASAWTLTALNWSIKSLSLSTNGTTVKPVWRNNSRYLDENLDMEFFGQETRYSAENWILAEFSAKNLVTRLNW